jgi:hypothetical protein
MVNRKKKIDDWMLEREAGIGKNAAYYIFAGPRASKIIFQNSHHLIRQGVF